MASVAREYAALVAAKERSSRHRAQSNIIKGAGLAIEAQTFLRETPFDWWTNLMQSEGPAPNVDEASFHQPALLLEVLELLRVQANGVYIDATVGQGGHAQAILQSSAPQGRVVGIDRDPRALAQASHRLEGFGARFSPVRGSFGELEQLTLANGVEQADGILMDLGFSSRQINEPGYGFSFQRDEPLDMRYDPDSALSAAEIVNSYSEEDLANLIYRYGEEPRSRAVARAIVRSRPVQKGTS